MVKGVLLLVTLCEVLLLAHVASGVRIDVSDKALRDIRFIALATMQRSSSTHTAMTIAQHPCILNGHEWMGWESTRNQDVPMTLAEIYRDPHRFLDVAYDTLTKLAGPVAECDKYVVVYQLFNIHLEKNTSKLLSVLERNDTLVVTLKRDAKARACSVAHAFETGDWQVVPGASRPVKDCDKLSLKQSYEKALIEYHEWYNILERSRLLGITLPFELVTSMCYMKDRVLPIVYHAAGLNPNIVFYDTHFQDSEESC
eukprot:m.175621 g.175621  ORF g.175621 m.175621 type:complete len:256 (-) comp14616_c0_seq8:2003-2770(-)